MEKTKLLMGNEAIAIGAIYAGVNVVCGYPGTPSTEVLETVAKNNDGNIYVEWSVNEKAAMEVGAGAAYSGARVLVTMKQVGLNVAADPLMSLAYIGVKGGMVILVADDPGPISSQTEQDTRHFGIFSKLPVFDPSTPEEAFEMVLEAFELSEAYNIPVFLRPTTRVCHACSSITIPKDKIIHKADGFEKDPKWVIFPPLSYKKHIELESKTTILKDMFSYSKFNYVYNNKQEYSSRAVIASGVSYTYACEAAQILGCNVKIIKLGCAVPLPEKYLLCQLEGVKKVLIAEELDPVIEDSLAILKAKENLDIEILGKRTSILPFAGEYSVPLLQKALSEFIPVFKEKVEDEKESQNVTTPLPMRNPVLCAGCPHRASFFAVKEAMKQLKKEATHSGDIGCYTLGNAKPLDMCDTCLCMGAGITIAQGLEKADIKKEKSHFAFIGDSTFFASGITGMINALYNKSKINIVVLDNSTTAMTGHQPHPGTGKTMMGEISNKVDIKKVCQGCGVRFVEECNPLDLKNAIEVVKKADEFDGVSVIIFKSPCIAIVKSEKECFVENDKCTGCKKCITDLGCPAISYENKKAKINKTLCTGCNLCSQVCHFNAIQTK